MRLSNSELPLCIGDGIGSRHKLLYAYLETVESRLVSNYGEFAIIVTSTDKGHRSIEILKAYKLHSLLRLLHEVKNLR